MNYSEIVAKARSDWLNEQRKHRNFLDSVEGSVPWWIVIIAATLFILSMPHTAAIFGMITPEAIGPLRLGYLAPLLVEFGILYTEFEKERSERRLPWHMTALQVLLWITAVLVNGIGSFLAVVSTSGLDKIAADEFVTQLVKAPIIVIFGIAVAVLAAFIIPIGTAVAGRGMALLILRREKQVDNTEAKWQRAAPKLLYFAFLNHLLTEGADPMAARERATLLANSYLMSGPVKSSPVDSPKPTAPAVQTPVSRSKKQQVKDALQAGMTVDEIISKGIAGRSVAFDAQKEWRAQVIERTNGNGYHAGD